MKAWIAAAAAATSVVAAAPATAATVTVTGDDGNPVTLAPGVPASIRNMDVDVGVALGGTEKAVAVSVAGPVAPAASPRTCSSGSVPLSVDYQGNGTYTVSITTYTDISCKAGAKPATYAFSVNASTALTPPTGAFLTRQPNSFSTIGYQVPIALNPGALTHEVRMAAGGVIAPDGSISGASTELFADRATGLISTSFREPGTYVMVARAKGYSGGAGQFFSPWSAPITLRVFAPFDFAGSTSFPDSRGPRYKLRATLREKAATGKVKISMARGGKGKFRSIGKARIRRGVIKKSFTQHRTGKYRLRFRYKGNKSVAPGTITQKIRITRRVFF
jgi:hypothetical protein